MRLAWLLLRSRGAGFTVAGVAAVLAGLLAMRQLDVARDAGQLLVLILAPAALSGAIGVGLHSPFSETERSVSRPLAGLRFATIAFPLLLAAVTYLSAFQDWPSEDAGLLGGRNLAICSGAALVSTRFVEARLAWVAPLALAVIALLMGGEPWPLRSLENVVVTGSAAVLLPGLWLASRHGAVDTIPT